MVVLHLQSGTTMAKRDLSVIKLPKVQIVAHYFNFNLFSTEKILWEFRLHNNGAQTNFRSRVFSELNGLETLLMYPFFYFISHSDSQRSAYFFVY